MLARLRDRIAIRWRIAPILTATMILLTLAFIVTITLLDISRARQIYWDEQQNRGRRLADQMNVLLADPLYLGNIEDVEKVTSIASSQPDIEYVRVFTPEGVVLTDSSVADFLSLGSSVDGLGQRALAEQQGVEEINEGVMEIAQPVTLGGQVIGGVQIGLRSDVLDRQVRGIIVEHIRQGVLLTIVAAGIAYLIARQFSRPVTSLVDATNSMASGHLDTRVRDVRGGELRELAGSFNTMAGELQKTIRDLQDSRTRIVGVQEGVRREIASHLHGRVQARLLVLRTQLSILSRSASSTPDTAQDLTNVIEQLDDLIKSDISTLSRRLYPSILRRGLVTALQSLTDQFESSFAIILDISDRVTKLEQVNRDVFPEPLKLAAYRIAEDALNNVVKHAGATAVTVRLTIPDSTHLNLSIEDNGSGFNVEKSAHGLGLEAMRDNAGAVGGTCDIHSTPGQGSVVTAVLPIRGGTRDGA